MVMGSPVGRRLPGQIIPGGRQGGQGLLVTVALVLRERRPPGPLLRRSGARPGDSTTETSRGALQKGESAGPEVVGQGPEGLGSQRHLGMKGPGTGAVEGDPAGAGGRHRVGGGGWATGLVDAAHAVDGHVLDQEILLDQAILLDQGGPTGGRGGGGSSAAGPAGPAPSSGCGLSSRYAGSWLLRKEGRQTPAADRWV